MDDSIRLAERAKQAGVQVVLESWDDMIHVWQMFIGFGVSESKEAVDGIAKFIQKHTSD